MARRKGAGKLRKTGRKPCPSAADTSQNSESDTLQFVANDAPMGYNPAYAKPAFTAFAEVGPDTQVDSLNLNWRESDLPERVRTKHVHRLHPYLGKFIPQLVEIFLRKYRPKRVCDPFCGSGTTLVEASVLGIPSIGCDVSPFNCLLSRVKTSSYDTAKVEREIGDILRRFNAQVRASHSRTLFGDIELKTTENAYLRTWFHERALSELLTFRDLIPGYEYHELLKVILSRAARSARLTTHFDLDFPKRPQTTPYECCKHGRICTPTTSAARFVNRYALDALARVREYASLRSNAIAKVVQGDARSVPLHRFDMVMTSPPYVGLIDYHEQHRYAYELLGLSRDAEPKEIGPAKRGCSEQARTEYVNDICLVFKRCLEHMPKDGVMVVVIGDRRGLYGGIAKSLGVRVEHILRRHVNRRTGRRTGDFYEHVLVWRKP